MGWTCPVCGAGVAPWMARCDCVNRVTIKKPLAETTGMAGQARQAPLNVGSIGGTFSLAKAQEPSKWVPGERWPGVPIPEPGY